MNNRLGEMQKDGALNFHKGFYLSDNVIESLMAVENERYSEIQCEDYDAADYLYTSARLFLQGSCNLFALALHEKFGYEVYEIRDCENRLIHVFCKSIYQGQEVYIDVRGATTNFEECFSEFRNRMSRGYVIGLRDIEEDKRLEDEGDETGYTFAQAIVAKYHGYYDV